ncbi:MAG: hypothetical protein DI598_01135 [Pseudopedobacter saltans]|uniref:Uncharacterized protein n=1 Tax=Pseudopedobacter saltans TaxID=151895 RepID=A0A2W5FF10_9SPHI|nr:MAG: hypothetical protein DI598_01135 [Pseudopedobacter saltans]
MNYTNKRLFIILLTATALLLVPFLAMQFSNEVSWSIIDFIVAGILLYSTGLACEMILRKVKTKKQKIVLCLIVLAAAFLIWAELAVGIFHTPFAGS